MIPNMVQDLSLIHILKRFKNIILGILVAGMLTVAAPVGGISAYASSAKISFSDPSATVGQEFSVNVKISSQDGNLGASDVVLSYDPSVIEFVSCLLYTSRCV